MSRIFVKCVIGLVDWTLLDTRKHSHSQMYSCFRQVRNETCSHMDEIVVCECGACNTLPHWYILTISWYVIYGLSYLKNLPRRYSFTMKKVRHLWVIIKRKWRSKWNLWVVGISHWRHHPQQKQQQTTSSADVTSVWHLFDSNVRIVEWFSWLIIKTALDRNQRVVTTNTCVFSLTGLT